MIDSPLPAGKLPPELLGSLLSQIDGDESVIVGPGIGRDAAAVRIGDRIAVLKTDPITFATDEIGWYLVNVNANDIACMGAEPRWLLVTALLPEHSTTPALVETIFSDLRHGCETLGISLVGGHTEITSGLDRPILVGQMIGDAAEEDLIDPATAQAGDAVILARGVAIEGTAILSWEMEDVLRNALDSDVIDRAQQFLHEPGISVVNAARAIRQALPLGAVHALHDPTEGGLATGLHELAEATSLGITVDESTIPVYPETAAICEHFALDPLGLIASGALLAVVDASQCAAALSSLQSAGIDAQQIGTLTDDASERWLTGSDIQREIPTFTVDEIARLFTFLDNA